MQSKCKQKSTSSFGTLTVCRIYSDVFTHRNVILLLESNTNFWQKVSRRKQT